MDKLFPFTCGLLSGALMLVILYHGLKIGNNLMVLIKEWRNKL